MITPEKTFIFINQLLMGCLRQIILLSMGAQLLNSVYTFILQYLITKRYINKNKLFNLPDGLTQTNFRKKSFANSVKFSKFHIGF